VLRRERCGLRERPLRHQAARRFFRIGAIRNSSTPW